MQDERRERVLYYTFAAGVGVLLLLNWLGWWKTVFGVDTAIVITLLAGYKTFYNSISALLERRISADIALCVAVIAALVTGHSLAAAEAMFVVLVGEGLESYAAGRTSAAIHAFVERLPREATLLCDGTEQLIATERLTAGDIILVRGGERIPADGVVESGHSQVDESSLTGEPLPKDKGPGDNILSGTLNGNAALLVRVTKSGGETTVSKVIALIEEAEQRRAPVERLADRYARYFLPALLLAAALTFLFTRDWTRTVAVLIVACPCALILATPTAMVAAIGGLARRGILVRGPAVLERAAKADIVVFDKTGTLTEGRFEVAKIIGFERSEQEVLQMAATAERASQHPLARILVQEALRRKLDLKEPETSEVLPGRGVFCHIDGHKLYAGSENYLRSAGVVGLDTEAVRQASATGATAVFVAQEQRLAGLILLRDRVREGAKEALFGLHELGLKDQRLLTGDNRPAADRVARELGIADLTAELLPDGKVDAIRRLTTQNHHVVMVGEGLNDAAALAAADVGIAVSGASDITAEAADVVYLPNSLAALPEFFAISRRAVRTAWQNIILFAGVLNALAVVAAATGKLGPVGAALTHQLSSFFVMMNSLRLLWTGPNERKQGGNILARAAEAVGRLIPGEQLNQWSQSLQSFAQRFEFTNVAGRFVEHWPLMWRPLLGSLALLYVSSGIYLLRPEQIGVVERFGRKVQPYAGPGLHYRFPWPVDRLTKLELNRVQVVEIGFRSNPGSPAAAEPSAYEWNVQHSYGRYTAVPEELLMLTGDQNMIELTATVLYKIDNPEKLLFRQFDADATVRSTSHSVLQGIVTSSPLDDVLTLKRRYIQALAQRQLQGRLDRYDTGVRVLSVKLEDVHPSQEVVDAFRQVSDAFEEKSRLINQAEGYRNEQLALARGNAVAMLRNAEAFRVGRAARAQGDASRFQLQETAFVGAPAATESRLYLETMEEVLPGKKKFIVDKTTSKRQLLLLEDGVALPASFGPAAP